MQVYIEQVIINNILINALILTLTLRFMRYKIDKLSIFMSSVIGAIIAVFMPIYDFLNAFVLKLILSLVMVAIVTRKCSFKRYVCVVLTFYALTFALGGAVVGIAGLLSYELADLTYSLIPLYIALGGFGLIVAQKLIHKYVVTLKRSRYEYNVTISANGKEVVCKAYYDSGNRLYYKNKPTVIVDESIALELYGQNGLDSLKDYTQIDTVAGKKNIKVFPLDYLKEENRKDKIYGVMAGVSNRINRRYQVVLHCDL